jgi:hypothetical protein
MNRVVYISYLDEAGLSKHETYLVVTGIVVPDNEMLKGEAALERILKKRIPEADHGRFEFHAHSLFTGSDYFSNKSKWTLAKRKLIIKDVLDILIDLDLPIIYGAINKACLKAKYYTPFDEHGLAFMLFAERVNKWVSFCAPKAEVKPAANIQFCGVSRCVERMPSCLRPFKIVCASIFSTVF